MSTVLACAASHASYQSPALLLNPSICTTSGQDGALIQVIPAIEEGILGMKEGGVRRLIVPPELGYPNNDFRQVSTACKLFQQSLQTRASHQLPEHIFAECVHCHAAGRAKAQQLLGRSVDLYLAQPKHLSAPAHPVS